MNAFLLLMPALKLLTFKQSKSFFLKTILPSEFRQLFIAVTMSLYTINQKNLSNMLTKHAVFTLLPPVITNAFDTVSLRTCGGGRLTSAA